MIILFRSNLSTKYELEISQQYCQIETQRSNCKDSLVVGRYSVLPYYKELETDLTNNGCRLINSYQFHKWIADFEYYDLLKEYTFESWNGDNFYLCKHPGPFVVKGTTNSRKHQWNKMMFAENKRKALDISHELANDSMIGEQGIIYRKYEPLKTYELGLHDLPFSNEWRFYCLGNEILDYGYYWSNAQKVDYIIDPVAIDFVKNIMKIVSAEWGNVFYVVDVAEKETGGWIMVELNDGQMSGPSENDLHKLYSNLARLLGV